MSSILFNNVAQLFNTPHSPSAFKKSYFTKDEALREVPGVRRASYGWLQVPADLVELCQQWDIPLTEQDGESWSWQLPSVDGLRPYQVEGVDFLLKQRTALLAHGMGLGKCLMSLTAAQAIGGNWLIIAPAITLYVWRDEIRKWLGGEGTIVRGGKKPQMKIRDDAPPLPFLILNYEILHYHLDAIREWGPTGVILDECHMIKNRKSGRAAAAQTLTSVPWRFALTGTPIANRPSDLWAILNWLRPKDFGAFWSYAEHYCLAADAPVLMQNGNKKPISAIRAGDWVMGLNHTMPPYQWEPTAVLEVHQQEALLQTVRLADDSELVCTPDHQWLAPSIVGGSVILHSYMTAEEARRLGLGIFGFATKNVNGVSVVDIQAKEGLHTVYTLTTTKGNYVAYGFVSKNCDSHPTQYGYDVSGISNSEELAWRLKSVMLRRTKAEVMKDLPAKTRQVVTVEADAPPIEFTLNGLAAGLRACASLKIGATVELVKQLFEADPQSRIIVFCYMRETAAMLDEQFAVGEILATRFVATGALGIARRTELIKQFHDTPSSIFTATLDSVGLGVDLSCADAVVFCDLDFLPSKMLQAEDRAYRPPRTTPLTIYYVVTDGGIDEHVVRLVVEKLEQCEKIVGCETDSSDLRKKLEKESDPSSILKALKARLLR